MDFRATSNECLKAAGNEIGISMIESKDNFHIEHTLKAFFFHFSRYKSQCIRCREYKQIIKVIQEIEVMFVCKQSKSDYQNENYLQ